MFDPVAKASAQTAAPALPLGAWTADTLYLPALERAAELQLSETIATLALQLSATAPELVARALGFDHDEAAAQAGWQLASPQLRERIQSIALAVGAALERERAAYYAAHPAEAAAAQAQAQAWGDAQVAASGGQGVFSLVGWDDVRSKIDAHPGWLERMLGGSGASGLAGSLGTGAKIVAGAGLAILAIWALRR